MSYIQKKDNIKILIVGLFCLFIILIMSSATYSFFNVEKTNNSAIIGYVESGKLSISVSKVAPSTPSPDGLIPQLEEYITYAVIGRDGKNCVDDNGNTVCHVYKVTLKNESSSDTKVTGTLALDKKQNPNLKWAIVSGLSNTTLVGNTKTPEETEIVKTDEYTAGQTKEYYIVVWINETCADVTGVCVPQTDTGSYTGSVVFATDDGNVVGGTNVGEKVYTQIDNSGANAPAYVENLIPVMYYTNPETSESNWVVADTTSSTSEYGWYDYDAKKWANAVLVNDTRREELNTNYKNSDGNYIPGTPIGDTETEGVLAFYVWIPRYKYRVWNINKIADENEYTYRADNIGIDIEFESGTNKTGTVYCTYSYTAPFAEAGFPNETCTDLYGTGYYTHPAFRFGNDEISGFWMGKFEISSTDQTKENWGGSFNDANLTPRILPNVMSWRNNQLTSYWKRIKEMQKENNVYGLNTDTTIIDTHMITNMEWGAVAYLTHSIYGRCDSNGCEEVSINNSGEAYCSDGSKCYTTYTGRSAGQAPGTSVIAEPEGTYTYDGKDTVNWEFVTDRTLGTSASTTKNIYGVYDMVGGSFEYTMGNMSSVSNYYTYSTQNAGSNFTYSGNEKYVITYAYSTIYSGQQAYNKGKLGDANAEIALNENINGGWYGDYLHTTYTNNRWTLRGGRFINIESTDYTITGIFYSSCYTGIGDYDVSSRAILVGF